MHLSFIIFHARRFVAQTAQVLTWDNLRGCALYAPDYNLWSRERSLGGCLALEFVPSFTATPVGRTVQTWLLSDIIFHERRFVAQTAQVLTWDTLRGCALYAPDYSLWSQEKLSSQFSGPRMCPLIHCNSCWPNCANLASVFYHFSPKTFRRTNCLKIVAYHITHIHQHHSTHIISKRIDSIRFRSIRAHSIRNHSIPIGSIHFASAGSLTHLFVCVYNTYRFVTYFPLKPRHLRTDLCILTVYAIRTYNINK